ncbi:MAG: hypothetical protein Q8Q14_10040, partial [Gemmatimonadales bacterium]|nr:hypothetical protein [Gemmatimonadales bacterium]
GAPAADAAVWAPWLEKAGGQGAMRRRMLEILIDKRRVTRTQLCTLAGASPRGGSTRNAISWLSVNRLVTRDGEHLALAEVV